MALERLEEDDQARVKMIMQTAKNVKDKVITFIPYNSNYNNSTNEPCLKNQPFHRLFWIRLMRARNDAYGTRDTLRRWHLNIHPDKRPDFHEEREVTASFKFKSDKPYSTISLNTLYQYLRMLPSHRKKETHKNGSLVECIEKLEGEAKNAVKFGIGNCGEMATLAFIFLTREWQFDPQRLEEHILIEQVFVSPDKGDHGFIVMARDRRGKLQDLRTWGKHAVILDPWMNNVVHVNKELQLPPNKQSHCFKYIFGYQQDLCLDTFGDLGQHQHTRRWILHRQKKGQPCSLWHWPPFYTEEDREEEYVPWHTEEKGSKKRKAEAQPKEARPRQRQRY